MTSGLVMLGYVACIWPTTSWASSRWHWPRPGCACRWRCGAACPARSHVEAREATLSAHASEQKGRAAPLAQWRHALLTIYLLTVAGAYTAGRWRARYIPE